MWLRLCQRACLRAWTCGTVNKRVYYCPLAMGACANACVHAHVCANGHGSRSVMATLQSTLFCASHFFSSFPRSTRTFTRGTILHEFVTCTNQVFTFRSHTLHCARPWCITWAQNYALPLWLIVVKYHFMWTSAGQRVLKWPIGYCPVKARIT